MIVEVPVCHSNLPAISFSYNVLFIFPIIIIIGIMNLDHINSKNPNLRTAQTPMALYQGGGGSKLGKFTIVKTNKVFLSKLQILFFY